MDSKELDGRRKAAQRDAERIKRTAPRIRLLNTPLHRNLDGERSSGIYEDEKAGVEPNRVALPMRRLV